MKLEIKCGIILCSLIILIKANKPKLSVVVPKIALTVFNDKATIDIRPNSTIRLKCDGIKQIHWTFPDNDPVTER